MLPNGPGLSPSQLHALLAESGRGEPREYRVSVDAFNDLMSGGTVMSWGPLLVNLAVTAGLVAVLMLATFLYAMRTRVHAIMDTIWPLGFVLIAAGVVPAVGRFRRGGTAGAGARAHRDLGAAARRAHLLA